MKSDYEYAKEKLFRMIFILATGEGDIKTRLKFAFFDVAHIKKEIFPVNLQSEWESVYNDLTGFGPIKDENDKAIIGSIENTLNHITSEKAREIAERILDLYSRI